MNAAPLPYWLHGFFHEWLGAAAQLLATHDPLVSRHLAAVPALRGRSTESVRERADARRPDR